MVNKDYRYVVANMETVWDKHTVSGQILSFVGTHGHIELFGKVTPPRRPTKTSVAAAVAAHRARIVGVGFRCGGGAQVYFDSSPVYLMKYRKAPISCRTSDQATLLGPLVRPQAAVIFTHRRPPSSGANNYYPKEGRRLSRWDLL